MNWVGGVVEEEVTFFDNSGNLADPTNVNANAKNPLGQSVVGTVVNQSVGKYDALFTADVAGLWFFRIEGEGGGVDAVFEGSFCVRESSVE